MKTLEIDVLKLYAGQIPGKKNAGDWNRWLTKCLQKGDLNELVKVRKGLQMGMSSAQRRSLVSEPLAEAFCRWIGSIDKTIRRIVKNRDKLANDSSLTKQFGPAGSLDEKRARDVALEKFLKKESY